MKTFVSILIVISISGCALGPSGQRVTEGAAVYEYHKKGDACDVVATSARAATGITVMVGKDCDLTIQTALDPDKRMQLKLLEVVNGVVEKLP